MRVCAILAASVLFGLTGTSLANASDSPGTIYIDGVPCNLPCQAYMDWSRRTLNANKTAVKGTANVSDVKRQASRKRVAKHVEPASSDKPPQKKAGEAQAALSSKPEPAPLPVPRSVPPETPDATAAIAADPETNKTGETQAALSSEPQAAPLPVPRNVPPGDETPAAPAARAADPAPLSSPQSVSEGQTRNEISSAPPAERTPQELVMAALAIAEQMTSAEPSQVTGDDKIKVDAATLPSSQGVDNLVAILIARPDVRSPAELKGQSIAIDKASGHEAEIRFALIAAGATGAELSATDAGAIDRVVRGDAPAAVLKLVSPEAAAAFPDVKDLNVLRVPLTPR